MTGGGKIDVRLGRKVCYAVDGGDSVKVGSFKVRVEPEGVTIWV